MIEFIEFSHGTPWHDRVLKLRSAALREPLGLSYAEADLAAERGHWHFALVEGREPVACLIAEPLGRGRFRLRQMAVAAGRRGRGLGRRLVEEVEAVLRTEGATELMLHARAGVTGFYERLGYTPVGAEFIEVTIPHREMVKMLRVDKRPVPD